MWRFCPREHSVSPYLPQTRGHECWGETKVVPQGSDGQTEFWGRVFSTVWQGKWLLVPYPTYEIRAGWLLSYEPWISLTLCFPCLWAELVPKAGVGLSPHLRAKWTVRQGWKYPNRRQRWHCLRKLDVHSSSGSLQSLEQISQSNWFQQRLPLRGSQQ